MRYSSNSRIALSKLRLASAEEVVTGSLAEAFFCAGWAGLDEAVAKPVKDQSTSR
jgi:hypothetical protein